MDIKQVLKYSFPPILAVILSSIGILWGDSEIMGQVLLWSGIVLFSFWLGILVTHLYQRYQIRNLKDKIEALKEKQEGTREALEKATHYESRVIKKKIELNKDGTGVRYQKWEEVRQLYETTQHLDIPHTISVTCPGVKINDRFSLYDCGSDIDIETKEFETEGWKERHEATITILKTLRNETVSFGVKINFEQVYCMSEELVKEAYDDHNIKKEYTALNVEAPIRDKAIVEVEFPVNYSRDSIEFIAFYSGSNEAKAHKDDWPEHELKFEENRVKAIVENPRPGLSYAIAWMPPKIDDLGEEIAEREQALLDELKEKKLS